MPEPEFTEELLDQDGSTANSQTIVTTRNAKSAPFITKAVSFLVLGGLLAGYWFVGQFSIGIPDELALQILTILLYNWFVENGYQVPRWFKKQ